MSGAGSSLSGGCLCGSVRFTATVAAHEFAACHCSICRRWSGGVFLAVDCASLTIENDEGLGIYRSSDYGERGFCKTCGSNLIWRMQDGSAAVVSFQALDEPSGFTFASEIFVDEKPDVYAFANPTKKMTGAEFIAAFAGEGT
ncbi:aldehyde-activating protein [Aureimonas sp. SA4125]|uniref:GFA family protein n=1 Tax=Aureimonas sp. SA4125 TaxID=2826993 RepID=UPI001CC41C6D|nr:GFA family protein [Aureimonas sp. SA4125]BDA84444.1 aldehyde-activating protein [Aureimonas sp. SA4125]